MPIEFDCQVCGHRLRVPETAGGRRVRCPQCSNVMNAPLATESPSASSVANAFAPFDQSQQESNPFRDTMSEPASHFEQEENPYQSPTPVDTGNQAYDYSNDAYVESMAKSKLTPPAVMLIIIAALGLLGVLANLVSLGGVNNAGDAEAAMILFFGIGLGAVFNCIILAGGIQMLNLKSRSLGVTAAILAMLPCGVCCIIGLPAGIWALVLLNDPMIIRAYRSRERRR